MIAISGPQANSRLRCINGVQKSDTGSGIKEVNCYRCGGNGIVWDVGIGDYNCPNCAGKGTVGKGNYLLIETDSGSKRHLTSSVVIIFLSELLAKGFLTMCGIRIPLADVKSAIAPDRLPKKERSSICKNCLWDNQRMLIKFGDCGRSAEFRNSATMELWTHTSVEQRSSTIPHSYTGVC